MSKKDLETLFNKIKEIALRHRRLRAKFEVDCKKIYGFNYDEKEWLKDNDNIIDSLDYGTSDLNFKIFDKLMNTKSFDETINGVDAHEGEANGNM